MTLLTAFFGWIFSNTIGKLVGGGLPAVIQDIINVIDGTVDDQTKQQELKDQLIEAWITAQVQTNVTRASAWGKWSVVFAGIFMVGPAIWWSAVFFVSVFPIPGYHVLALPSDFLPWMSMVVSAAFLAPTIHTGVANLTGGNTDTTPFTLRKPVDTETKN